MFCKIIQRLFVQDKSIALFLFIESGMEMFGPVFFSSAQKYPYVIVSMGLTFKSERVVSSRLLTSNRLLDLILTFIYIEFA